MKTNLDYREARDLLLGLVQAPGTTENVPLEQAPGRILAETVTAAGDVPPFDRSPFDGYAFRAADTAQASRENPAVLRILEEIPAGGMWTQPLTPGTAAKILTGAPVPPGADAVTKYEDTEFDAESVKIFTPFKPGENIIYRGEDVHQGDLLAEQGTLIDSGLLGTLAAQGIREPRVFIRPRIGIVTTGSELVEPGEVLTGGKIVNTNRYTFLSAVARTGCEAVFCGAPGDNPDAIAQAITAAAASCDMVITTGGVSVGDYDFTPEAMELAGGEMLIRSLQLKPGGASAYGMWNGKLLCGLSGNPASALTNFYAVVLPVIRKLMGYARPELPALKVTLKAPFKKKTSKARLIRGRLDLSDGTARMEVSSGQGNGVLHSLIGCDLLAEIPSGTPPLPAGAVLDAYLIP